MENAYHVTGHQTNRTTCTVPITNANPRRLAEHDTSIHRSLASHRQTGIGPSTSETIASVRNANDSNGLHEGRHLLAGLAGFVFWKMVLCLSSAAMSGLVGVPVPTVEPGFYFVWAFPLDLVDSGLSKGCNERLEKLLLTLKRYLPKVPSCGSSFCFTLKGSTELYARGAENISECVQVSICDGDWFLRKYVWWTETNFRKSHRSNQRAMLDPGLSHI